MSDVANFLRRIVAALNAAGISHMVAGSFASTHHGRPRTTQDIDFVIDPSRQALDAFVSALPTDEYYVDRDAAIDALRRRSLFNVIDHSTGWKADLIVRKARPYSVEEFSRRQAARMLDVEVFVATAEDTVLTKLEWAKLAGGSERQLRDAEGIVEIRRDDLDRAYMRRWARELGVEDLLESIAEPGTG